MNIYRVTGVILIPIRRKKKRELTPLQIIFMAARMRVPKTANQYPEYCLPMPGIVNRIESMSDKTFHAFDAMFVVFFFAVCMIQHIG